MSQENIELVMRRMVAFQEQGMLRALPEIESDFVWDLSTLEYWPDETEYVGREGFDDFLAKWTEAYEEFEQSVEEVIDAGDEHVIAVVRQRGRPRGSDAWAELVFGIVWTIKAGRFRRGQVFRTREDAVNALGPGEPA